MAVYGARLVKSGGETEVMEKRVKSATTITKGDFVSLENDRAIVTTAALPILGVAMQTVVNGAGGTETIQIFCGNDNVWEVDNDNDTNTFAADSYGGGLFFNIIGTTGAMLVDTSSATATSATLNLVCVDETPSAADTSLGWFKINKANSQF